MPLDPELAERYATAKQEYDERAARAASSDEDTLDSRERYREALAAYVLDLQVNGMTVTDDLAAELAGLDAAG